MSNLVQVLKVGSSGLSLAVALAAVPAIAQQAPPSPTSSETRPATASDQAPEDAQTPAQAIATATITNQDDTADEIIVTGTSLRGVAPVGSNLISVGRETIEETAVVSVQQILKTVPAVVGLGSAGQGGFGSADAAGTNAPTIHGLGASASNSTLIIIDGHRIPLSGVNHALGDPNIVPPIAIQRVEVLPDGASSIYGSDAVAGVINFITRERFDGVTANAQYGFGDDYQTYQAGVVAGHTWESGSMLAAYNFSHRDALSVSARDFLLADHTELAREAGLDLNQPGAATRANRSSFFCDPASITIGSNVYRFNPTTGTYGNPVANSQGNAFCDNTQLNDIIPAVDHHSFLLKINQEIGDRLEVGVDFVFSNRKNSARSARGTVQATVFGPGSTPPAGAGQINPFFVPVPGTTANSYTVRFSANELLGAGAVTESGEKTWYVYPHAEYEISDSWVFNASAVIGASLSRSRGLGELCTTCAILALNGTLNENGRLPSEVTNLPLTVSNALDVWQLSNNRTSPAVLRSITDSVDVQEGEQGFEQFRVQVSGDLYELPAGAMKLAVGAEYLNYTLDQLRLLPANLGPGAIARTIQLQYGRDVKSAFAEVFLPIVGPEMDIPGVRSFDVNVAWRYDDYSDFGTTTNPKIGANWEIFEGFKVRGNWSKSFVAPALTSRGADDFGTTAETSVSGGGSITVPIANYPNVTQIPGISCSQTTCQIGTPTIRGLQVNGGDASLQPQKGTSWAVGADFIPQFFRGLRASVTFWHNEIKGGITAPQAVFSVLGDPTRLQIFPTGASQAQLDQIIGNRTVNTVVPPTVYYVYDFRQGNVLNLVAEGIDAEVRYVQPLAWGEIEAGVSISQKTRFDQSFGTGPTFSVLNTTGFNTTFPSIKTDLRADLGLEVGPFGANFYLNHTGAYMNWGGLAITPLQRSPEGLPIGGGDPVASTTTFDLHLDYELPDFGVLPEASVFVDVTNVFDKEPVFYSNNNGYDTFTSNPIGRVITFGIRSTW